MTGSLETKVNNVLRDLNVAGSKIRAGKLFDLSTLESDIQAINRAISKKEGQPPAADTGRLKRQIKTILAGLNHLEKLVTEKKGGQDLPT